jgi:hypothetical protein
MQTRRFGRKIKLPSTVAIKHQILKLMIQDELRAQALAPQAFAPKAEEVLVAPGHGAAEMASRLRSERTVQYTT